MARQSRRPATRLRVISFQTTEPNPDRKLHSQGPVAFARSRRPELSGGFGGPLEGVRRPVIWHIDDVIEGAGCIFYRNDAWLFRRYARFVNLALFT